MNKSVRKVILTRVENLPMKQRSLHGFSGKAVIEISKNSPLKKETKTVSSYTDYFYSKFTSDKTPEEIRDIAKGF